MALHHWHSTNITGGQVQLGDNHHVHHHTHYGANGTTDAGTILAWLSSLNFGATLTLHCNKRAPSTGTWLLEDPRYISWRECDNSNGSLLWCRGNPGSGKTILCSTVVQHVRNSLKPGEAVVYCFFDYARRQELTPDAVLADLLVQLASRNTTQILPILWSLYEQSENGKRRPTLAELTLAFQTVSSRFEKLFVVVDALDECVYSTRRQFLLALRPAGKGNIHMLVFSRPHAQPSACFGKASIPSSEIEIQPLASDLLSFVGTRIADNEDLGCIVENSEITVDKITDQIIEKAGFSFLAAEMRLNAIQFAITAEDLTRALQNALTDPTDLYAETLTRIKDQHCHKAQLALKVLAWLSLVKRPLTIRELCHALGIQLCKQSFSRDHIPAPDIILNSCFGLVIRDRHNDRVRLLHYTLLEYLEQYNLLEFSHQTVLETCLKCLSAPEIEQLSFSAPMASSQVAAIQMQILRAYPFSEYAAVYWFAHVYPEFQDLKGLPVYLANRGKMVAWRRLFDFHDPSRYRQIFRPPLFSHDPSSSDSRVGIKIAAALSLHEALRVAIADKSASDKHAMNTMLVAAVNTNASGFLEMLLRHGLDPCHQDTDGNSLLHQIVTIDLPARIVTLTKHGADLNQRNSNQQTPLQIALALAREGCSLALIQCGADLDVTDSKGNTALHKAAMSGASEGLVQTLLKHGARTNARNISGQTALNLALGSDRPESSKETIVRALLEYGSPLDADAVHGNTALHHACIWSWSFTTINTILVQLAMSLRCDQKATDFTGYSSPAVESSLNSAECAELLSLIESFSLGSNACDSHSGSPPDLNFQKSICNVVFQSISRCQTSINLVNSDRFGRRTPLHYAVLSCRPYLANFLLQAGASVNRQDQGGETALHLATRSEPDEAIISLLLDHGASALVADYDGCTVLEIAMKRGFKDSLLQKILLSLPNERTQMSDRSSPLMWAIDQLQPTWVIEKLLSHYPNEINSTRGDGSALHLALRQRRRIIIKRLLSKTETPPYTWPSWNKCIAFRTVLVDRRKNPHGWRHFNQGNR